MTTLVPVNEVERFRCLIGRCLGLHIDDGKLGFLADVLNRRIRTLGRVAEVYLAGLETEPAQAELAALAQELTVGETYFFRNNDQFRAFVEVCLPDRLRAPAAHRRLKILSAGCASGEEAYSLAMLMREHPPGPSWEVSILAVDVNPVALEQASRARFSNWSLRETPAEVRQRWFHMDGRDAVLDEEVKASVRFERRNLVADDPGFWLPETYDVIFCRNVLMYFTPDHMRSVVGRLAHVLAPGGYLFLGHAETLRGISVDFHLRHTHGTFYYQRKHQRQELLDPQPERRSSNATSYTSGVTAPLLAVVDGADTWVEAIQRASERIQVLTASHSRPASSRPETGAPSQRSSSSPGFSSDLGSVLELVREERFSEALTLVGQLPSHAARDPDVLLLRAVLLAHGGQPGEAEVSCRTLLEIDELNAGAHYVLALCREEVGDRQGAVDHDQMAVYLDRAFAMPHLHLGLLARKDGDRETARREFSQALVLLQREDPSRLLLFGGGFSREALVALCRAELVACDGQP